MYLGGCQDAKDMTNNTFKIWTKRFKCQKPFQFTWFQILFLPGIILAYFGFLAFRYFQYLNGHFIETPHDLIVRQRGYWERLAEQEDVIRRELEAEQQQREGKGGQVRANGSPQKERLRRRDVRMNDPEGTLTQYQSDI